MGSKKNQLETIIAQKNDQIFKLKAQQQVLLARNSLLQSRLLSTLDALDAMQNARTQESNSAFKTESRLKHTLGRYIEVVREAEEEKDDMRDAILKLVEKVELSNGYESLPHSQFRLASLAEPCQPGAIKLSQVPGEELLTYASSMIQALRQQRDNERKSHTQTQELYNARVAALEAKLSRRDSELECCAYAGRDIPSLMEDPRSSLRAHHSEPLDLASDSEDMISILHATNARNRLLEVELKELLTQLEKARQSQSTLSLNQVEPKDQPPPSGSSRTPSDELPRRTPQPMSKRRRGESDDTPARRMPSYTEGNRLLAVLNREVQGLAEKIDAIADERRMFFDAIPHMTTTNSCHEAQARTEFLEVECSRLRRSESHLLEELQSIRNTDHIGEREGQLVDEEPTPGDIALTSPANGRQTLLIHDPFDPDDGEKPMELATPLLPVSVMVNEEALPFPVPGRHCTTMHDPTSMLDPASPINTGVDLDDVASTPPPLSGHFDPARYQDLCVPPSSPHIQQVEPDLAETEFQLQAGENALDDIESFVRELRSP